MSLDQVEALQQAIATARQVCPEMVPGLMHHYRQALAALPLAALKTSALVLRIHSAILEEDIAIVGDDYPRDVCWAQGITPYCVDELQEIEQWSNEAIRRIHPLKKVLWGDIIGDAEVTRLFGTAALVPPWEKIGAEFDYMEGLPEFEWLPAIAPAERLRPDRMQGIAFGLKVIAQQIRGCRKCPLSETRTQAVPGEGSVAASVVIVGEAPGAYEDASGRPFVGNAGRLLEQLLEMVGLRRKQVYILNTVKCRPPKNRVPTHEETACCRPYLDAQLALLDPDFVVCLGRTALNWFLPGKAMVEVRGQLQLVELAGGRRVNLLPTWHPAATFHDPAKLDDLKKDFAHLKSLIDQAAAEPR